MRNKPRVSVTGGFFLLLAMLTLLLPLEWVAAWLLASAFHELGHYVALKLCGVMVYGVVAGASGVRMYTGSLQGREALLCALAGPAAGLCLVLCASRFPRLALCAGVQSFYNLLPVGQLDGARALESMLLILLPERKAQLLRCVVGFVCTTAVLILCALACLRFELGMLPAILGITLLVRVFREKYLANRRENGYNSPTM